MPLRIAHTADLTAADHDAIWELLVDAFKGDVTREDYYDHAVGGLHVVSYDGDDLIGHASVIMRRLVHQGRALRAGYVEAVAVRTDRQRQGHGAALMDSAERIVRDAYELGALGTSDEGIPFYRARGWLQWQGTASVISADGVRQTPEEAPYLYVLPVSADIDVTADLACYSRPGDDW